MLCFLPCVPSCSLILFPNLVFRGSFCLLPTNLMTDHRHMRRCRANLLPSDSADIKDVPCVQTVCIQTSERLKMKNEKCYDYLPNQPCTPLQSFSIYPTAYNTARATHSSILRTASTAFWEGGALRKTPATWWATICLPSVVQSLERQSCFIMNPEH